MKPLNLKPHEATGLQNGTVSLIVREVRPQPGTVEIWKGGVLEKTNVLAGHKSPLGKAGDTFWCRETWQVSGLSWGMSRPIRAGSKLHYKATDKGEWKSYWGSWRSPILMPRWASRISIETVDVQVKRLGEIHIPELQEAGYIDKNELCAKIGVWDRINGKGAWGRDKNKLFAFARVKRV